jgi:deoxyribodipyrimidine photolyase-related protein
MSKKVLLLYPNQLFAVEELPKNVDEVVLVEEPLLFGVDTQHRLYMHKQKLVFHRATMRRYMEEELWPAGYRVDYIEYHHLTETGDIVEKLKDFEEVSIFELNDDILSRRLMSAIESHPDAPSVNVLPNPNFYLSIQEIKDFFANKNKSKFSNFYQWQRERFNILIDPETYKPIEGKWKFEIEDSNRLPKNHLLPSFQVYGSNDYVGEAVEYVNKHFPDNPGSCADFPWPTNRQEAWAWFSEFLEHRLEKYSMYQNSIDGDAPWIYHSGISPLLNIGLLKPHEVVNATISHGNKKNISIDNVESFIRQIVGWREYIRGLYQEHHITLRASNNYHHTRRMTADWYNGTTGIPPVDDVIHKTQDRGYANHVERLMILGNIMFLCEFHPDEIYRWFMEMYIDSYEWSVIPNVYGISQDTIGETGSKPSISSSNYILSKSYYEKGDWCDIWDGLYWRCIEKNTAKFSKNQQMKTATKKLKLLNENRLRIISYRAEDFLKNKTILEKP